MEKRKVMSSDLVLELSATASDLHACLERIEESCTRWNVPGDTVSRLRITVEELFSNTIKYGYGGECGRPVRVTVRGAPQLELVYEDEAPPFDPTAWRGRTRKGTVGRKGIALVLGITQSARYERLAGANRLTLRFG
jgi:anti-sigma regulatory factor (Ser/Thr protein kinase)